MKEYPSRSRASSHQVPLNIIIEADHGKRRRLIKPTLGFQSTKTAYATIKEIELMRMFKKSQMHV